MTSYFLCIKLYPFLLDGNDDPYDMKVPAGTARIFSSWRDLTDAAINVQHRCTRPYRSDTL